MQCQPNGAKPQKEGRKMAHEITVREDGFAEAVYARTPAWHGLGHVKKDGALVSDELIPYVNFDPILKPTYWYDSNGERHISTSASIVVRSDTEYELGVVSPNYAPYSHLAGIKLLDSLMMDGIMKYEAAFTLRGGRDVCIVVQVPGSHEVAEGDTNLPFLMALFNHTGRERIRMLPTLIRPVCANTIAMALAKGKGEILSVRHSGDMQFKMSEARNALAELHQAFTAHTTVARRLAKVQVPIRKYFNGMSDYLDGLYPLPSFTDPDFTNRRKQSVENIRSQIIHNFLVDPAQQVKSTRHSWYAAFNAVTQYIDHHEYKGRNATAKAETAFRVANLGTGNDMKQRAWNSAVAMSN